MKKNTLKLLLLTTILCLALILGYWIKLMLQHEYVNLKTGTNVALRETISTLTKARFEYNYTPDTSENIILNLPKSSKQKITITSPNAAKKISINDVPASKIMRATVDAKSFAKKIKIIIDTTHLPYELLEAINQKKGNTTIDTLKKYRIIRMVGASDNQLNDDSLKIKKINQAIVFSSNNINDLADSTIKNTISKTLATKGINIENNTKVKNRNAENATRNKSNNKATILNNFKKESGTRFSFSVKDSSTNFSGVTDGLNGTLMSNALLNIFSSAVINEPLSVSAIDSLYKKNLRKNNILIPFKIAVNPATKEEAKKYRTYLFEPNIDTATAYFVSNHLQSEPVVMGLTHYYKYNSIFTNVYGYLINKIKWQIIASLLILMLVSATIMVLYRSLQAQAKLATMKNDFISNITHELKTPIATVNVAVEALRNFNAIDDKQKTKDYLDISAMEISRLGLLVDNVLKISMFENNKIELQKENFDLMILLQEVVIACSIQLSKAAITLDIAATQDVVLINADKLHIASILFNLIDNAIKYSHPNGTILIDVAAKNNALTIAVIDNGIGIAKENIAKVFNKFYRVSTGDIHNVKGYGLGLSYVDYIVKKHNGTIALASELNKGSKFIVTLPIA